MYIYAYMYVRVWLQFSPKHTTNTHVQYTADSLFISFFVDKFPYLVLTDHPPVPPFPSFLPIRKLCIY